MSYHQRTTRVTGGDTVRALQYDFFRWTLAIVRDIGSNPINGLSMRLYIQN